MGFQLYKYFEGPATETSANFVFKSHGPSSDTCLTNWTDQTKGSLGSQWPLWGTFQIPKLNFLKTELDYKSSKISRTK